MRRLTMSRPDDWHLHLRDGAPMTDALRWSAEVFGRAVVMPNLRPPVATVDAAVAYRRRILAATPPESDFEPLMTLYLTDRTTPDEIALARSSGVVHAIKLYPAGATTNSDGGVTDVGRLRPVFEAMQLLAMPLLVHAEVNDPEVDIFDREAVFLERVLGPLTVRFPDLRVVLEHVTTRAGVDFVTASGDGVAATVTPQHLLMNRNDLLAGGVRPHHYCLPVLKRESDREAVLQAATSGSPKFFLGTDSAPHPRDAKETDCGCAGCFSAPAAIGLYAEAFDAAGAIDRLEAFACHHGADFYRLPRPTGTVTLVERTARVPAEVPFGGDSVVPLRAGGTVGWSIESPSGG